MLPKQKNFFYYKKGNKILSLKHSSDLFLSLSILHALRTKKWLPGYYIYHKALQTIRPIFKLSSTKRNRNSQVIPIFFELQKKSGQRALLSEADKLRAIYASFLSKGRLFKQKRELHRLVASKRLPGGSKAS